MPLIAALPVRVRFSTLVPSEKLTALVDPVGAAGGAGLDHLVAGIVDDIGVVADAAAHGVGADAAVEDIGAVIAGKDVGKAVAGAVDRAPCR